MFFLIGHRGVGKTTIAKSFSNGIDLDEEIEKSADIKDLLDSGQEKKFRELELSTLKDLLPSLNENSIVALGAGFEFERFEFPSGARFVWVQRRSDHVGRVFLNRPRLNKKTDSLTEFQERRALRVKRYRDYFHFKFEIEEGGDSAASFLPFYETLSAKKSLSIEHGYYTVLKLSELDLEGVNFELRTDFHSQSDILEAIKRQSEEKQILVAIRTQVAQNFLALLAQFENVLVDIPVDQFEKINLESLALSRVYLSEHDYISTDEIAKLNRQGFHVKWAPEVESFDELMEYHELAQKLDVSFLPRSVGSQGGRWNWYRQLTYHLNKITFFRFGLSDLLDQPAFYELCNEFDGKFSGAVLGSDVRLSHSPAYHRDFVHKNFGGTYVRASIFPDELTVEHLEFMNSLGLGMFSITNPFKNELKKLPCGGEGPQNTLTIKDGKWSSTNTDLFSIRQLAEKLKNIDGDVLIWGKGAIGQTTAEEVGSNAKVQSIREYKGDEISESFKALVWSAGSDCDNLPNLTNAEKPSVVYDIEYKEHSRARELALDWGAEYVSGKEFFRIQAEHQQDFWLKALKGDGVE